MPEFKKSKKLKGFDPHFDKKAYNSSNWFSFFSPFSFDCEPEYRIDLLLCSSISVLIKNDL